MIGVLIITIIALILSILLVFIDAKLDTKNADKFLKLLPGYNCGSCGYAGCEGMCQAMMEDINNYKKCRPLKGDKLKEMEEFLKNSN